MAPNTPVSVIELRVQVTDGYLYISSDDVPGLHLCGRDIQKLFALVGPAIKRLFKLNKNLDVEVTEAVPPCDLPGSPQDHAAHAHTHRETKHYVMFPARAAAYGQCCVQGRTPVIAVRLLWPKEVEQALQKYGAKPTGEKMGEEHWVWVTSWGHYFLVPGLSDERLCPLGALRGIIDELEANMPRQQ